MEHFLAIDIGASSGRHIVGWVENGKTVTDEVYRFPNSVKQESGHAVWDVDALVNNVKAGIAAAFKKYEIKSMSVDTWGVDYVLLNGDKPVMPCYSYRDGRTAAAVDAVHGLAPFDFLYSRTGIQFQPFNTVYQLYDDKARGRLDKATDFLMIPEYINYVLTGVKKKEYTNATTTGLLNAATGDWDGEIVKRLGLNERLFACSLCKPGSAVGLLKPDIAREVGGQTQVVLCASHDTGSAVEGIPMTGNQPYISSGTWSLLGVKLDAPLTDEESRKANYTNEGGVGYIRYQKNIMGMWVVNGLKRELCPDMPFDEVISNARKSGFTQTVDINDDAFLAPVSMKEAFDGMLAEKPKSIGDYFNCAFLSLAESYKKALAELERITGTSYSALYIVGGGAKNKYLNELTERAIGKTVVALPIEATALGNLKIQINADKEYV